MARRDRHNRARYWADPTVPGLSLLHADFTCHDYAPHSHDALVIAATEAGGAEYRSRGLTGEADPSALMVFNPVEPHAGRMGRSRRWRYRAFYLEGAALGALGDALGLAALPYFTRNLIEDRALIDAFLDLHRALEGQGGEAAGAGGGDLAAAREGFVASFGLLLRRHAADGARRLGLPRDRGMLARLVGLMRDRLEDGPTLDDLAAQAGMTPFQVIALFKRGTGLTPHAYLTQLRLDRAKALLERGRPIAEAALAVGFCDQSALQRHFKRVYGFTPLQYAQARAA